VEGSSARHSFFCFSPAQRENPETFRPAVLPVEKENWRYQAPKIDENEKKALCAAGVMFGAQKR